MGLAGSRNGSYGILATVGTYLLHFDVGRPDHLAPLLGFVGDELPELGGRGRKHGAAQVGKPRLNHGIGKSRVDRLVELINDFSGPASWRLRSKA
jgi:hypothetical protein